MRTSPMYALPVLKEGCPGGGWAGSCTGAGLEHSLASWLSRTNLEVLFCALNDISALLSQVKRSRRKQAPNSSCYIDLLVNSSPFPLFKLINLVHYSVFFIDFSQHLWLSLKHSCCGVRICQVPQRGWPRAGCVSTPCVTVVLATGLPRGLGTRAQVWWACLPSLCPTSPAYLLANTFFFFFLQHKDSQSVFFPFDMQIVSYLYSSFRFISELFFTDSQNGMGWKGPLKII